MDCKTCKENRATVPYIVHEAAEARHERTVKRLFALIALLVLLLVGSNVAWLVYESQYEDVVETETYSVDMDTDDGNANYIGGDGDIYNGENPSNED